MSDRIRLSITASAEVLAAIRAFEELVKGETLALELELVEGAASSIAVGEDEAVDVTVEKL